MSNQSDIQFWGAAASNAVPQEELIAPTNQESFFQELSEEKLETVVGGSVRLLDIIPHTCGIGLSLSPQISIATQFRGYEDEIPPFPIPPGVGPRGDIFNPLSFDIGIR
ncbi:ComC/BlpC family leader-containing pheromone/bacteriocin [Scytonema sp. UIC 10036]|uniref:ComC/BlpC family leader-containing pheromone/bacteriocin n=1 Tax=Scytonema sp. UIC 10036 TaxID=2304196 RepID=UPI0012DAC694|nr:ComC/BlpC family leader-containing pheromone/bacteriocin [Scytonema sp. UIC 10036]MUH00011.1 ComC/BlpC family leader-containing pheromone/bacteriocin [Scytonema sp. UIC 10036]